MYNKVENTKKQAAVL